MPRGSLLLISPVYNEIGHIERVVRAVSAQTRPPTRWIVVDDGSTDGTREVLQRLAGEVPFLDVLTDPPDAPKATPDRLAVALEARAFNRGLAHAGALEPYDYIGKLDGDIEPPPHWYETLLSRMDDDPSLGIAGATLEEPRGDGLTRLVIPQHHVHGAVKVYRRDCFEAIGGMQERLAWDTIDETYARMHGYRTCTYRDLVGLHLRPAATADGALRGRARHGECAWILHYPPAWVALRSFKMALSPPVVASGLWFLWGYLRSALRRVPQVEDPAFRRFTRYELRVRVATALRRRSPVGA
jgi:poly-beta-1,6-N-acetyl-D-glucosamine synthase